MTKVKPFAKQILIQPIKKGGILGEVMCEYGKVLEIGDAVKDIKVGDTIGYERYGLKELKVENDDLVFISEDSDFLLCKLENNASN